MSASSNLTMRSDGAFLLALAKVAIERWLTFAPAPAGRPQLIATRSSCLQAMSSWSDLTDRFVSTWGRRPCQTRMRAWPEAVTQLRSLKVGSPVWTSRSRRRGDRPLVAEIRRVAASSRRSAEHQTHLDARWEAVRKHLGHGGSAGQSPSPRPVAVWP